ncbi:helix-turn-helix domain-containing protein [Desulfogranum japonicum]|uniref:helix-turn-helix domain-containing protein n=1 Tax=Desulfogranum japonicum TaxID=231447 RepID=UPI0003F72D2E|nr:helix-turn-helix transcriptional regulator [Desulfogranum japonicum]
MAINLALTNRAIAKEIGGRLKQRRLNKNISQREVAEIAGISITAVQGAEKGETTLLTIIKILRVFREVDALELFLPEVEESPLLLVKKEKNRRKKATGKRSGSTS